MNINDKIVDWILKRAQSQFADDIAMILLYGSYVNGTANEKSDVDCYFIPKTDRAYGFCADFILDGVGYDVFPMSWERVEKIADLKETLIPCLGDVRILYASSAADEKRFFPLQEKLRKNLADCDYTVKIGTEKFEQACELFVQMRECGAISGGPFSEASHSDGTVSEMPFAKLRMLAGYLIMALADAVAVSNGDYFHFGLKKQHEDLQRFKRIPADFTAEYLQVIKSKNAEETMLHCRRLIESVSMYYGWEIPESCEPVGEPTFAEPEASMPEEACDPATESLHKATSGTIQKPAPDFAGLAELYEEISSTFNKIYVCAQRQNPVLAFLSAACLQGELAEAAGYEGVPCLDILSAYDYDDLSKLAEATEKAEAEFVRFIEAGGGRIKRYASFEEFERAGL